jgi:hypothetical protein
VEDVVEEDVASSEEENRATAERRPPRTRARVKKRAREGERACIASETLERAIGDRARRARGGWCGESEGAAARRRKSARPRPKSAPAAAAGR